ncbi:unnamed protein product, partial [Ixodes hexagonus]
MGDNVCRISITSRRGQPAPTSALLRRLFGLSCSVKSENKMAGRSDLAYYEDDLDEHMVHVTPERSVAQTQEKILNHWCDMTEIRTVSGCVDKVPDWWLSWPTGLTGESKRPVAIEHKEVSLTSFALGTFLGLNTFVEHYTSNVGGEQDGAQRSWQRITQCNAHFAHYKSSLLIYFVDVNEPRRKEDWSGDTHARHRFQVQYTSICRIVLTRCSDGSTVAYLHLLCAPLLYKARFAPPKEKDQKFEEKQMEWEKPGKYVSQFDVASDSKWFRVVQFGTEKTACSSDKLGRCHVLALKFPAHAEHPLLALSSLVALCPSVTLLWAPVQRVEAAARVAEPWTEGLPFGVRYGVEAVWSCSAQVADELSQRKTTRQVEKALRKMAEEDPVSLEETLYTLQQSIRQARVVNFQAGLARLFARYRTLRQRSQLTGGVLGQDLPPQVVLVRRAVLTPTHLLLLPPQPVCTSRIMSCFQPEYAVRVIIRDEDGNMLSFSLGVNREDFLSQNTRPRLLAGFTIGGRKYEFLASSTSQLRSHGVWFYSRDANGFTAENIRGAIGDLSSIHVPSKYMARLGQAFSQSMGYITVPQACTRIDEDVLLKGRKPNIEYNFSDGVGRISQSILARVHAALPREGKPCAIQIRYGGCKGMLVLDPTLDGDEIVFRKSMYKFPSQSEELYILKTSKPRVVKLNRPMITILSQKMTRSGTQDIEDDVFMRMQRDCLEPYLDSLFNDKGTAALLQSECTLRMPYRELAEAGLDLHAEPFFRSLLWALHHRCLKDLKDKMNILVPPKFGRTMFGVMDETSTLQYGQVYVQYSTDLDRFGPDDQSQVLTGGVIVTKNPCIHPGDIRLLEAVDVPALKHIRDCVVFPQIGKRPHPDEMAGSDLDGDEYSVIWYEPLLFKRNDDPMDFYSSEANVACMRNNARILRQVQDMVDFMCTYIVNDVVGLMGSAHLAWADLLKAGVKSNRCLTLARKCSECVDFAKTGKLARLAQCEKPMRYPDFMEKHAEKYTYPSKRVLGKLYRELKGLVADSTGPVGDVRPDRRLLLPGREEYVEEARKALREYELAVRSILMSYGVGSEAEALSGAVLAMDKHVKTKHDPTDVALVLESQVQHLMERTRAVFLEGLSGDFDYHVAKLKASAWYEVSYEGQAGGSSGFAWAMADVLLRILHDAPELSAGERHVRGTVRDRLVERLLPREDQDAPFEVVLHNNALLLLRQWLKGNEKMLNRMDSTTSSEERLADYTRLAKLSLGRAMADLEKRYGKERLRHRPSVLLISCLKDMAKACHRDMSKAGSGDSLRVAKQRDCLGVLALHTLQRLLYHRSGKDVDLGVAVLPAGPVKTEVVLVDSSDTDFYLAVMRNEHKFRSMLCRLTQVEDVQIDEHTDVFGEQFLRLMVTGVPWAIDRLKSTAINQGFQR